MARKASWLSSRRSSNSTPFISPNGGRRGGSNRGSNGKRGNGKRGNGKRGNGKRGNGKRGNGKRGNGKLTGKQIVLIVAAAFVVLCLIAQCSGGSQSPSSQPTTTQSASEAPTASGSSSAASAAPSESASDTQAAPSQTDTAQVGSTDGGNLAQTLLDELAVQDPASKAGYSRDQFGAAWSDVDHNGCDTRNDILKRDMTNVTFKDNTYDCVVLTGTLSDPYTGKTIAFERGQDTSKAVQIDHVVALSNAWQTGAQNLSADQRLQLANDPYNLLAVDGPANQEKSDSDAASWLPSNTAFDCEYVARQIGVKHKYALWVTAGEKSAMQTVLATCPSQSVPTDGGVSDGAKAATQQLAAQNSAAQDSAAQSQATQDSQAQVVGSGSSDGSDVYYARCADARAAGKAPLYAGQPGYREGLDGDNDGVACETRK